MRENEQNEGFMSGVGGFRDTGPRPGLWDVGIRRAGGAEQSRREYDADRTVDVKTSLLLCSELKA